MVLVAVLVLLGVVFLVPVAVARCGTFTYTETTLRSTNTTPRTTNTENNKTKKNKIIYFELYPHPEGVDQRL